MRAATWSSRPARRPTCARPIASGTPAFGVGAGNVAGIVDESADVDAAAERIVRSKTFDNATSCSSENSVVIVDAVARPLLAALAARGARAARRRRRRHTLQTLMWPDGKLSPAAAPAQIARARIARDRRPRRDAGAAARPRDS